MVPNYGDDSSCHFEEEINFALYPSLQGGLRNNHSATPAIALEQERNYEKVCEACYIMLKKCAVYNSTFSGGVRIGE